MMIVYSSKFGECWFYFVGLANQDPNQIDRFIKKEFKSISNKEQNEWIYQYSIKNKMNRFVFI